MAFKKIYRLKGGYYYQTTINFKEYDQVKRLLGDKVNVFKMENAKYGEAIDEMYNAGILRDLFQVIVKPYNGTIFHRAVNYLCRKKAQGFLIDEMIGEQIAEVINDFFICNVSWMTNLLYSYETSVSPMMRLMKTLRQGVGKLYSVLHKRILQMQLSSGR